MEQDTSFVSVREARSEDIEKMVRFNCELARETEDKILDPAVVTAGVRRGMASKEMCRYFVAESSGKVVGQTMITYELTDWRDGVFYWIQSVYVEPEWRGRGVFRALFEFVEKMVAADPAGRGIRLYVDRGNKAGIATYERLGMHRENYDIFEIGVKR